MRDEEYVYVSDVRDKKITARSARHQRTHNGRRGRVKLPSDFLTKKELEAMNGEMKAYRLNDPMSWKEFKSMPDDLKETYIKLIRERYNPYDFSIAEMMGVHRVTFANEMKRLNLGVGKKHGGERTWDKEGWNRWSKGIPADDSNKDIDTPDELIAECEELPPEIADREFTEIKPAPIGIKEEILRAWQKAIPSSGNMTFNGDAEAALRTMIDLLGGADVHLTITWETCDE